MPSSRLPLCTTSGDPTTVILKLDKLRSNEAANTGESRIELLSRWRPASCVYADDDWGVGLGPDNSNVTRGIVAVVPSLVPNNPRRREPGAQPIISSLTADQPVGEGCTRSLRQDLTKDETTQRLRHCRWGGGVPRIARGCPVKEWLRVVEAGYLIPVPAPKCGQRGRPSDTGE